MLATGDHDDVDRCDDGTECHRDEYPTAPTIAAATAATVQKANPKAASTSRRVNAL
jgi:hypothetical protein